MLIFNRWGQLIYESNEVTKSWDGKYKGKQVESGVYTYRIEALDRIEKIKKVYNGKVTVVR
jgi:gliding motility-associated-like protein